MGDRREERRMFSADLGRTCCQNKCNQLQYDDDDDVDDDVRVVRMLTAKVCHDLARALTYAAREKALPYRGYRTRQKRPSRQREPPSAVLVSQYNNIEVIKPRCSDVRQRYIRK